MKVSAMRESNYLKKEDLEQPKLLTIKGFEKANVARDDQPPDIKWLMTFEEAKPLVMNGTNLQLATHALGSDDTDDWIGKKIVAYADPTVAYQGKLVGGVRLRAPKKSVAAAPTPPQPDFDDELGDI